MVRNDPTSDQDFNRALQAKCAYDMCECPAEPGSKYCCSYCHDAAREREIEIQCDCKHAPCALN